MRLVLGVSRPRQPILGSELSGVVEVVGKNVSKFKVGDRVFAFTDSKMGCYVEYRCIPEGGAMVQAPSTLSFAEAAAMSFGGTTALYFLRRAKLQRIPLYITLPTIWRGARAAMDSRQNGVCLM